MCALNICSLCFLSLFPNHNLEFAIWNPCRTFLGMNASSAHAGLNMTVGQKECFSSNAVFLGIFPSVENGISYVEKCSYH